MAERLCTACMQNVHKASAEPERNESRFRAETVIGCNGSKHRDQRLGIEIYCAQKHYVLQFAICNLQLITNNAKLDSKNNSKTN